MAFTNTCTFYPDYTSDTSFCNSLGHGSYRFEEAISSGDIAYTRFYRVTTYSDSEFGIITDGVTDFDRCLPGPTSCGMQYSDGPCPVGYDALSRKLFGSTTTDYCCLKLPLLDASYVSISLPVNGGTLPIPSVDVCYYAWFNTPDSVFPTATIQQSVTGSAVLNQMFMKAVQAVYTTTTSPSPGSVSSIPSSTSDASSSTSKRTKGMSAGSKAGVTVGASIGGILLISGVAIWIMLTHRTRRQKRMLERTGNLDKPELHGEDLKNNTQVRELHEHTLRGELATKHAHELPDTSRPVEIGEGKAV